MADKIDAWMPLHIGKYMAATGHLSTAEHGMYLLLLMHAWTSGGGIPGDSERIRRICRAESKEWAKARDTILAFWHLQPDGTYRQKRLDTELTKATEIKEVRAEAGKKGAAQKWQSYGKPMAKVMANAPPVVKDLPPPEPMANRCPIPSPEPEPVRPLASPTTPDGGDTEEQAHNLASICAVNRVKGAAFNSPYVVQWIADGVTGEHLRNAIAEARRYKPDPEQIPIKYLLPIVVRVQRGGGSPVDNAWKTDDNAAISLCEKLGIPGPKRGEDRFQFQQRIEAALYEQSRATVQ